MKTMSDTDVINALRAADPAAAIVLSSAEATDAVRRSRSQVRPRLGWKAAVGSVVAIIAIGVPAGAVATGYAAQTGWFGTPNPGSSHSLQNSTESDGTEWIDLDAPDRPEVVSSLFPGWMPLAPGVTREALIVRVNELLDRSEGLEQVTGIHSAFEHESYRDWITEWIAAHDSGDADAETLALKVLSEAPDWPAMAATDGGGVTDVMREFARRIAGGDADAAQALAQTEGAQGWDRVDRSALVDEVFTSVLEAKR